MSQFIPNPVRCYNVRNLATLNSTAGKMMFAINVGKNITLTPRNAQMNQNLLIAKEIIH